MATADLGALIGDADARLAVDPATLGASIERLMRCAAACTACASACLAEGEVEELRDCIATNDVCAEICVATARALSRLTRGSWEALDAQLQAAEVACSVTAEECRRHSHHEHCQRCADACEEALRSVAQLREAVPADVS